MLNNMIKRALGPRFHTRQVRDAIRFVESLKYFDLVVWDVEKGNRTIAQALLSGVPQAIGRLGSVETDALRNYLHYRRLTNWQDKIAPYQHILYSNAGVFPDHPGTYDAFCQYMLSDILPQITVFGVWFNYRESHIVKHYAGKAKHVPIQALETYSFNKHRWTAHLEGKKVLVLHPFVNTIHSQYEKRKRIWNGQDDILPPFELLQIAVPYQPILAPPRHTDWFQALADMQRQMTAIDFDVALIGAGAYSLPLVVHAKKLGKVGIHMGGAVQLYFGIMGGRWDKNPAIQSFVNESWVRPLPEDTPPNNKLIEGGCYW